MDTVCVVMRNGRREHDTVIGSDGRAMHVTRSCALEVYSFLSSMIQSYLKDADDWSPSLTVGIDLIQRRSFRGDAGCLVAIEGELRGIVPRVVLPVLEHQ